MWYIKPSGQAVTRKQFLDSLSVGHSLESFENAIFMRLFKSGLTKSLFQFLAF